ncbi:MAG: hypothetical protein JXA49_06815 [Actinobacteria bacterium]|nr:hypothetical protein [Actinomycetota bacterium]
MASSALEGTDHIAVENVGKVVFVKGIRGIQKEKIYLSALLVQVSTGYAEFKDNKIILKQAGTAHSTRRKVWLLPVNCL